MESVKLRVQIGHYHCCTTIAVQAVQATVLCYTRGCSVSP